MDSPLAITDEYLEVAYEATERAVQIARERPGAGDVEQKGASANIVTETDRRIERELREFISERYPDHGFIGEEYGRADEAEINWILDPIDGTSNYYHDVFPSCTLVGLEVEGELHAGITWMHEPDDVYYAVAGEGAYRNHERIIVNDGPTLGDVLAAHEVCENDVREDERPFIDLFCEMQAVSGGVRKNRCGGYGVAMVASGGYGAFAIQQTNIWDIAPGTLLVREAGGRVSSLDGEESWEALREVENGYMATNGSVHNELLGRLAKHL